MLDYATLRIVWWVLLGVLLIGFAVMDGFDLGVAMWLPWLSKEDSDRRIMLNSIAPTWEGNQVWFVLGGGAIFAAWPSLYALSFSGFYLAMLIVLLALIIRPVGIKYRSKLPNTAWRQSWDYALCVSGIVPALIFGVAVGNALQGVPFYFDDDLRSFYTGSFGDLLNPFALLCGVLSVCMLAMHGAFFLNVKTTAKIQHRAQIVAQYTAVLAVVLFVLGGIWVSYWMNGYEVSGLLAHDGPSNPLYKKVIQKAGAWLSNFQSNPITIGVPVLGIVSPLLAAMLKKHPKLAFVLSALSLVGIIATVGISMFPFLLPSSSHPSQSLIVWDSSSSQLTLFLMLIATGIFLPIILCYTAWVYRVLRGKVTEKTLIENQDIGY